LECGGIEVTTHLTNLNIVILFIEFSFTENVCEVLILQVFTEYVNRKFLFTIILL
jgi:hypothetical protein